MTMDRPGAYSILVIDDDQEWHEILSLLFASRGWTTAVALSGDRALALLSSQHFDVVVCDLSMPRMDGIEVLRRVRALHPFLPFIMMTGVGTIASAVEAVQLGAYSYLTKPVDNTELTSLVQRAAEHARLQRQLVADGGDSPPSLNMMVCSSSAMQQILKTIAKVASTGVTILITGETGTGKTRLAEYIHKVSSFRDRPFLTIDCASLPESLLESELFGHVKGAFTGAVNSRRGLLQEAEGGTVFLDEIGELSLATQAKLLCAIQEHTIRPVGGNKAISVNVRFIAATNRRLEDAVKAGTFRDDLYYRLTVIPLYLPPLRERGGDLAALIGFFISRCNERYGRSITRVSPAAMRMLCAHSWPGNIRELENVLERACLLTEGDCLMPESLDRIAAHAPAAIEPSVESDLSADGTLSLADAVRRAEMHVLQQALAMCGGNRTHAAEMLGIGRRTLYDKMEQLGLMDKKGQV